MYSRKESIFAPCGKTTIFIAHSFTTYPHLPRFTDVQHSLRPQHITTVQSPQSPTPIPSQRYHTLRQSFDLVRKSHSNFRHDSRCQGIAHIGLGLTLAFNPVRFCTATATSPASTHCRSLPFIARTHILRPCSHHLLVERTIVVSRLSTKTILPLPTRHGGPLPHSAAALRGGEPTLGFFSNDLCVFYSSDCINLAR